MKRIILVLVLAFAFSWTGIASVFATPPAVMTKHPCSADLISGPPKCKPGYVHRMAGPTDYVCVLPDWHRIAQIDNANAAKNARADGTCKSGDVWREAFPGDRVCVSPEVRMMTREQNSNAASTRACN